MEIIRGQIMKAAEASLGFSPLSIFYTGVFHVVLTSMPRQGTKLMRHRF